MTLQKTLTKTPAEPLWKRVPTRTDAGELAADFMMIIPGLKHFSATAQQQIYDRLYAVLQGYGELVMLAEVNMLLNTLWVSHLPRPGLGAEIAAMIHHAVPEAKVIAQRLA